MISPSRTVQTARHSLIDRSPLARPLLRVVPTRRPGRRRRSRPRTRSSPSSSKVSAISLQRRERLVTPVDAGLHAASRRIDLDFEVVEPRVDVSRSPGVDASIARRPAPRSPATSPAQYLATPAARRLRGQLQPNKISERTPTKQVSPHRMTRFCPIPIRDGSERARPRRRSFHLPNLLLVVTPITRRVENLTSAPWGGVAARVCLRANAAVEYGLSSSEDHPPVRGIDARHPISNCQGASDGECTRHGKYEGNEQPSRHRLPAGEEKNFRRPPTAHWSPPCRTRRTAGGSSVRPWTSWISSFCRPLLITSLPRAPPEEVIAFRGGHVAVAEPARMLLSSPSPPLRRSRARPPSISSSPWPPLAGVPGGNTNEDFIRRTASKMGPPARRGSQNLRDLRGSHCRRRAELISAGSPNVIRCPVTLRGLAARRGAASPGLRRGAGP